MRQGMASRLLADGGMSLPSVFLSASEIIPDLSTDFIEGFHGFMIGSPEPVADGLAGVFGLTRRGLPGSFHFPPGFPALLVDSLTGCPADFLQSPADFFTPVFDRFTRFGPHGLKSTADLLCTFLNRGSRPSRSNQEKQDEEKD